MPLEQRVKILEKDIRELKKSTFQKNGVPASDKLKETIPDRASCLSCAPVTDTDEPMTGWGFRLSWLCGELKVHEGGIGMAPAARHRDRIIERVISELQKTSKNPIRHIGRCMALLQLAAEIEICSTACGKCREQILVDLDNPPFKNPYPGWKAPGVEYLKGQLRVKEYNAGLNGLTIRTGQYDE